MGRDTRPFPWKSIHTIIGGVLITIGVAGELYVEFRASRVENDLRIANDQIVAAFKAQAAKSEREAATLRKEGEGLRLQVAQTEKQALALQQQLIAQGSRSVLLYGERREHLIEQLRPFGGQKVEVRYCNTLFSRYFVDTEAMSLAMLLRNVLLNSNWSVSDLAGENCGGTGVSIEVSSKAPESARRAAKALLLALVKVPIVVVGNRVFPSEDTRPLADRQRVEFGPLSVDTIVVTVLAHP